MEQNKTFTGSWIEYQDELKKYITEKVIQDNWNHFIECYQKGDMPCRAVKLL